VLRLRKAKKQLAVVSCQLQVVSCQWSVVSGQWSVVSGIQSVVRSFDLFDGNRPRTARPLTTDH
jgi:hypothetical protein